MKKLIAPIAIILSCALLNVASAHPTNAKAQSANSVCPDSSKQTDLRIAMRKLWDDHVTYTRNYILSALDDSGDIDAVAKRLMQNQDDIGNAMKPYYGGAAANKLASLLRDHIKVATEVVAAAKKQDKKALDLSSQNWNKNADDIANFLSSANPNWPKATLTDMLHKHLELTTDEVTSRLNKNWKGDIKAYDQGHDHMMMFSDSLTDGIIKQFPEKFK